MPNEPFRMDFGVGEEVFSLTIRRVDGWFEVYDNRWLTPGPQARERTLQAALRVFADGIKGERLVLAPPSVE